MQQCMGVEGVAGEGRWAGGGVEELLGQTQHVLGVGSAFAVRASARARWRRRVMLRAGFLSARYVCARVRTPALQAGGACETNLLGPVGRVVCV